VLNAFLAVLLPLSLVFGLYHLFTWFNVFGINRYVYWKRVGLTAAISHFLLVTGFFAFTYYDWQSNRIFVLLGMRYETFVLQHSEFWQLLLSFDTIPGVLILGIFSLMGRAGMSNFLLPVAMTVIYVVGTLQWFFVFGGIGAGLQRLWDGLKTGEEGEQWFQ
jgi:hypothetical protein